MYCPQCSHEQVVAEQRFCSRCGFPLAIVSQLVANGGALKVFNAEENRTSQKKKTMLTAGALLMIIGGLLTPTAALLTAMKSDLVFVFGPVLMVFLSGLTLLLYTIVKHKASSSTIAAETSRDLPFTYPQGLPTPQSIPISPDRRPADTAAMAQPASVTETTTKLLD